MTTQQMFYEKVVPINSQRHSHWYVDPGVDYSFAKAVNSVPLMAVEIPQAARDYTIVFTDNQTPVPVVLLAADGGTNVYVTEEGGWDAKYIPAFVRRYPFVFSRSEDGNTYTLCIDESWAGCNQEGRGERLFDDEGKATPYVENVLKFLQEYQRESQRTQLCTNKLKELDLLDSKQAQIKFPGGEQAQLKGFMIVNREKLQALPSETLGELAKTGELELIYAHLQSMSNMSLMLDRMAARRQSTGQGNVSEIPAPQSEKDDAVPSVDSAGEKKPKVSKTAKPKAVKPS